MSGSHLCPLRMNVRANRHPSAREDARSSLWWCIARTIELRQERMRGTSNLSNSESPAQGRNIASGSLCNKSVKRTSLYFSLESLSAENHIVLRLRSHPGWSFEQGPGSDEKRNSSEHHGKKCQ